MGEQSGKQAMDERGQETATKDSEVSSLMSIVDRSVQEVGLVRVAPVDARKKSESAVSKKERSWQEIMDARQQEAIDRKLQSASSRPAQQQEVTDPIRATLWGLGIGLLIATIWLVGQLRSV